MKVAFAILLTAALLGSSLAQTKTTGSAKSDGSCSPAVTGDNNTFIFRYCGSDPEEKKKILKLLQAISQGEDVTNAKLDEILEILLMPIKIYKSESTAIDTPTGKRPRAAINFSTEDPVDRGQFEILCDRACTPVDVCQLMGQNSTIFAIVSDQPTIAEFLFQRQFPALTLCKLVVESRDEKPVRILNLNTSKRTTKLIQTGIFSSMATAGSVMR